MYYNHSYKLAPRFGKLGLSTWQNIFFCEFDGPRRSRTIAVTVLSSS
ncbi:MAG: YjbQ family protein [Spirochaetota bacterium]